MPLKKSAFALWSSNSFPLALWTSTPASHPSNPPPVPWPPKDQRGHQARQYAAVHQANGQRNDAHADDLHLRWPSGKNPTPYEVFNQEKGAPYNKALFYALVKVYHPDRHHHTAHDRIPHAVKIQRYHLIISANDILSDPVRRRAYDLYGAGWGEGVMTRDTYRRTDRTWRQEPGNAANNATWEDWEHWYRERDGKKQEPLYMSNGTFVSMVALFILIGGWGQATRAEYRSLSDIEMRDRQSEHINKEMQRRQSESADLDRDSRVQSFLRQREGWGYSTGHLPQDPEYHEARPR